MSNVAPDAAGRMPADVMTQAYKKQALHLLKCSFHLLSVASIRKVYAHVKFRFLPANEILSSISLLANRPNFDRHILQVAPFLLGTEPAIQIVLKTPRKVVHVGVRDPILRQEVNNMHAAKENSKSGRHVAVAKVPSVTLKDPPPLAPAIITLECVCCFGDYPIEEICQCEDGHLFCCSCVRGYVQEEVFGKNSCELHCLSMDGCALGFSDAMLKKALPAKVLVNFNKLVYRKGVEAADVDNLA
jgi:hypothetical protein